MLAVKNSLTVNEAWHAILERYNIVSEVADKGVFYIKAAQIKEYKEPRLMAKWDSSSLLPSALRSNKLNILPNSRSSYVIGDFILYQRIPELEERVEKMTHFELPDYETIRVDNITSEANAINVLILSGILDDFLETGENAATFNGRMGTGEFGFYINTYNHDRQYIHVQNAQCEIDGGFENDVSVVIMEAKNVLHEDFNIRQLYYPYRLWQTKVNKPIRLVFSVYSNMIYRLFEYRFSELSDFSSIELVKTKNYSLQDTVITMADLEKVRRETQILTDDNQKYTTIPFVQADSMDRVVNLLENLYENPMTIHQVAMLMKFEPRQSDYYYNAGRYLGLFERAKNDEKQTIIKLTRTGENIYKLNYKERQLKLISLILQHRIFADAFDYIIQEGELPPREFVIKLMREYNVCNEGETMKRRATSVICWLRWMIYLTQIN